MKRYGELRKREPHNLEWVKRYAEVARSMARFDAAREALMWWKQKAHHDPRPRMQLVELLGEMGDFAAARKELQELSRLELVSPQQIEALDLALTEALQGS